MYKVTKVAKGTQYLGPKGVGVIVPEEVAEDLKAVTGAPDIENHPRGILFLWAVEHAPTQTLQDIANAANALTDEQAATLFEFVVSGKTAGVNDWKMGWRNALYYGLANAPGA